MRKRIWIPLALLLALVVSSLSAWYTYPWESINPDFLFRFFALNERYQLTPEEQQAAVKVVHDAVASYGQPDTPADAPREVPEKFTLRDPRPVWVSLYLPPMPVARAMADEPSIYRSLRQATHRALEQAKDRTTWLARAGEIAIQIDVMQDRAPVRFKSDGYLFFDLEPGVDGIILTRGRKQLFQLPSEAVTRGLLTPRKPSRMKCINVLMEQASRDLGGRRQAWKEDPDVQVEKFRTLSFGEPVPGKGIHTFFRGNVLIAENEIDSQRIYRSITEGAKWLLDNAREDGTYKYEYFPNKDEYPTTYNAVRHAGAIYGLLELYQTFQDPKFLEAARAAAPYLYANIQRPGNEEDLLAMPDGRNWPTGAAALSLLAFVEMPPEMRDARYQEYEEGLARFLLRMIDERGSVFEGYRAAKASKLVKKEPEYYPGESMLALMKLYDQTKDRRWLEASQHIAEYQIARFRRGRMADHWVIQGLYQLYHQTKDESYGHAALEMADSYIETQCPPNMPPFPDYFGAYRRENETPRTTRAGSRSEAMTAAVRTAWELGVDARPYEDSLLWAARHQIDQQFRPENAFYLPHPERAIGGFRAGLIDNHLRIDFNQHSCVGLIGALEVAVKREKKEPWWKPLQLVPPDVIGAPGTAGAPVETATGTASSTGSAATAPAGTIGAAPPPPAASSTAENGAAAGNGTASAETRKQDSGDTEAD
jgi:hypothetical protein